MKSSLIKKHLKNFIDVDKYQAYADFHSSPECTCAEDRKTVTNFVNNCASELLVAFSRSKNPTTEALQEIFDRHISDAGNLIIDTEDREFVQELTDILMNMVGAGFKSYRNKANHFLNDLQVALNSGDKILKMCMECGHDFSITVHRKDEIIPECWAIIKCDQCKSIDYIDLPAGLADTTPGGFECLEILSKNEFSRDLIMALVERLQQS